MTDSSPLLITGATGYLGLHLIQKLVEEGRTVFCLVRQDFQSKIPTEIQSKLNFIPTHLNAEKLAVTIQTSGIESILHLATYFVAEHKVSDLSALLQSNIEFGTQLLEAASIAGVRKVLNIGSYWQHFEGKEYSPVSLYAATKQAFEDILKFYAEVKGLSILNLKLAAVYGPNDPRQKVVSLLLSSALSGKDLSLSPGRQLLDLVYVDDAVDALLTGLEQLNRMEPGAHQSFTVSSGNLLTLRDVAGVINKVSAHEIKAQWGTRPYRGREFFSDWRFYSALPGWTPRHSLEQGVGQVLLRDQASFLHSDLDSIHKFAIYIPAYNAASTLPRVLVRIPENIKQNIGEILVVDNASPDNTHLVALQCKQTQGIYNLNIVRNKENKGYGGSQKIGYQYCIDKNYKGVAMLHGDAQYAPELLMDLLQPILRGEADMVFGSRIKGNPLAGGMPIIRFIGNKFLTWIQNVLLGTCLSEFHSGYRVYSVDALKQVPFNRLSSDYHFDTEILILFIEGKFKIAEMPIPTYYGNEKNYVNIWKYGFQVLVTTLTFFLYKKKFIKTSKWHNILQRN